MLSAMITTSAADNKGSFATVVKKTSKDGKTYIKTTTGISIGKVYSRRLLLNAAIAAVKAADEHDLKLITSDSYVQQVIKSYPTWETNGHMTKPLVDEFGNEVVSSHKVANWDLISALAEAIRTNKINLTVEVSNVTDKVKAIADDILKAEEVANEESADKELEKMLSDISDMCSIPDYNDEALLVGAV